MRACGSSLPGLAVTRPSKYRLYDASGPIDDVIGTPERYKLTTPTYSRFYFQAPPARRKARLIWSDGSHGRSRLLGEYGPQILGAFVED